MNTNASIIFKIIQIDVKKIQYIKIIFHMKTRVGHYNANICNGFVTKYRK